MKNSRTPAYGGISLSLRGSGASGATFGRLRRMWKKKKNWGAYAAFGGDK